MRKNDWLLAGGLLLAAGLLWIFLYPGRMEGHAVLVMIDGEEYGRYDLEEEQIIEINGKNRLEIRDGQASMTEADCPDQICVHSAPISHTHEMIVCMPNRVTVEVVER